MKVSLLVSSHTLTMFNRDRKGANQLEHWQVGEPVDLSHEIKRRGSRTEEERVCKAGLEKVGPRVMRAYISWLIFKGIATDSFPFCT